MPDKVLLVGPVHGRLLELVSKTSAIQAKHGPFAALFIVGDLFASTPTDDILKQQSDLLAGTLSLPIPTYFYQALGSLPADVVKRISEVRASSSNGLVALTEQLHWAAGKSGVFTTAQGLRVAFVAGNWDAGAFASDGGLGDFDAGDWHESPTQREEDEKTTYITPSTVRRLLAHPSFRLPKPSVEEEGSTSVAKEGTLASARASASAEQARAARQGAALEMLQQRPALDLLLTNTWPAGVTLFATGADADAGLPDPTARTWGSPVIARLAAHACARYHFALAPSPDSPDLPVGIQEATLNMGAFWERAPYTTDLASYLPAPVRAPLRSVTRFVSLATFGNSGKRRWFVALNLTPADEQGAVVVPPNATPSPYAMPKAAKQAKRTQPAEEEQNFRFGEAGRKRARADGDAPPPGYVCRICGVEGHFIRACPSKTNAQPAASTEEGAGKIELPMGLPSKPSFAQGGRQMIPVGPANCWFCLSNPSVEKQLIVTIGSASYLVRPKGPFIHPSANEIPHTGAHFIIVPLAHVADLLPGSHPVHGGQGDDGEKASIRSEVESTKAAVRAVWAREGHVMLEWTLVRVRTSPRMTHFQTQLLALKCSIDVAQKLDDALEAQANTAKTAVLRSDAAREYFDQTHTEDRGDDGYLHIKLHAQEEREWLVPLYTSTRFPVQFVRATLAAALELPQLADWKACTGDADAEQERHDSAALRAMLS
ncbi:nuclear protein [Moesziomyces antarcticus]|uniref:Nuclear protein n=2 Tax=Pseudozyma antarctica TaxID=84753 RepID=A0A081CD06_PSEA2|nr:nuclear protein [Moesziomyces antarcticus]GAK64552.1 nuclear protein [Moesziomyces antarcticus]SPO44939.1 uncharacterized protein PSANT_02625 [Moesziomyces antarcticus]